MILKKKIFHLFLQKPSLFTYFGSNVRSLTVILGSVIRLIRFNNFTCELGVAPHHLFFVLYFLKNNTYYRFDQLIDITAEDTARRDNRYSVRYELLSVTQNARFALITTCSELTLLPSVTLLYPNAGWLEREIWDLYGIFFVNNPDLRRILTDYGFKGHPLRKDFPLSGFVELFYNDSLKKLDYVPVSLSQEYRDFKFSNPWLKS